MRGQLLIVLTAVVAGLAAYSGTELFNLAPLRDMASRQSTLTEQLADLRSRITRTQRALDTGTSLDAGVVAQTGTSASSVAALFQESTRALAAQFGGSVKSSQSTLGELGVGFSKVSDLLRARFDEAGLLAFLRSVEMRKPINLVESMEVHPLPVSDNEKPLDVTATLTEFYGDHDAI
jgi:hypothetical protein